MYKMPQTQKNQKRAVRQMSIWQEPKPRGCPQNPTELHPLVKLFNWMKSQGHFKQFKDFEDYRAHRNDPAPKPESNLAMIEAMEKARVRGIKK